MVSRDVHDIVIALLERTRADQVNWQAAEGTFPTQLDDDFYVILPNSTINVFRMPKGPAVAAIQNSRGEVIAQVDSATDKEMTPVLDELLGLASRKVHNIDGTLGEIKDALASPNRVGKA